MVNIDFALEDLYKCKFLQEKDILEIISKAKEIFIKEENIQKVSSPITICGDIHGQFYDLLELFLVGGTIPNTNYLFTGDYVDRGYYSVECFSLLITLKIKYPRNIFLTRGNHESRQVTQVYGFYDECLAKYGNSNVWKEFTELFDILPLSAIIDNKIFSLHGGLSPSINLLDEIKSINRQTDIPNKGGMCDLLWSDPDEKEGFVDSTRGAGYMFGSDVTSKFIYMNNLKMICRAHQVANSGYKYWHDNLICTIFSAPNYCYRCGNQASIMEVDQYLNTNIQQYDSVNRNNESNIEKENRKRFMYVPQYFL